MALRYDFLNMMRNRVGAEGVSPEELQAIAGWLEASRRALADRKKTGELGFFDVPKRRPSREAMAKILRELDKEIDTLVVVGIGGSLLGARAAYEALHGLEDLKRGARAMRLVFAGDATDPRAVRDVVNSVDWKRAAINVVSKIGDTIEPMAIFALLRHELMRAVGREKAMQRIIATTDAKKGTLHDIAARDGYVTLPVPENVGGRFSVLTEVGAFPLLAAGINVDQLWKGAAAEEEAFWKTAPLKSAPMVYAALQWLLYRRGKTISVFMPYAKRLALVGEWYCQLWAESLGKQFDRKKKRVHVGPTPVAALGPGDQHSQIQLYNEGPSDKIITFVEVDDFDIDARLPDPWPDLEGVSYFSGHTLKSVVHAERKATAEALTDNRRPNGTLRLHDLSGHSLGALFQSMMIATAIAGELFDVNAFDQPGVEAGKKHMYRLLERKGY